MNPDRPADPPSGQWEEALLVFLRHPEPGETKTRLIPRLGPEKAALVYRRMAERVTGVVRALDRPGLLKVVFFSPAERRAEVEEWMGADFHYLPQPEGDLGRKLVNGFVWAFGQGAKRVTAIGTDCVDVTGEILEEAFEALLDNVDASVGPALDGGYYLIGLSRLCGAAFRGIPWSTDRTLLTTLSRLRSCGLRVRLLPPLSDIDRPEDLDGPHSDLLE